MWQDGRGTTAQSACYTSDCHQPDKLDFSSHIGTMLILVACTDRRSTTIIVSEGSQRKDGINMINENIKKHRKKKGISQEEMAVKLNVVRQTVSKWEKGLSVPDFAMLIKISELLEVSVGDLLGTKIPDNAEQTDIAKQLERVNEQLAIKHTLFRGRIRDYILVAVLGIAAGMLVALFLWLPDNSLWDFSYFSSDTYGFWMFTTAFVVLFSAKRHITAINAGLYVFFLFLITTAFQSLRLFHPGSHTPYATVGEMTVESIGGWLWYSIAPAVICAVLGFILWGARKNTTLGKLLLFAPLAFLVIETCYLLFCVFAHQTKLFSAFTDIACIGAYCLIIKRLLSMKRRRCI